MKRAPLTAAKAARLKPLLDAFVDQRPWTDRIAADPVEFPHRYKRPADQEVAGLIAASLAYGRASFFKPRVAWVLERLGASPAKRLKTLRLLDVPAVVGDFTYRFNVPADLGVLLLGTAEALRRHGSLERLFLAHLKGGAVRGAQAGFMAELRDGGQRREVERLLGKARGLAHLLPSPEKGGAAKRLNLFLRWMVRPKDGVDLGVWRGVAPSQLLIPLDTHVGRMARLLGLTSRFDLSFRTAEEVTASLRLLCPEDPVRYDFALCHAGMSGLCPRVPATAACLRCELRPACASGTRRCVKLSKATALGAMAKPRRAV